MNKNFLHDAECHLMPDSQHALTS